MLANISEIRSVTMAANQGSFDEERKTLVEIMRNISLKILLFAGEGKSKAFIDLQDKTLHPKTNHYLKQVVSELALNGYGVGLELTRTPNGARSMTITW